MEIKVSIFREFLEEQLKESVDILGSSIGIAGTITAIGITNVQWLIQENNVGVAVPRILVENGFSSRIINSAWTMAIKQSQGQIEV
jgi:hypothetical protein